MEQYLPAPGKASWLLLVTTKATYPRLSGIWAFEKQLTGLGTAKPSKPGQDKLPRKPRCSSMLSPHNDFKLTGRNIRSLEDEVHHLRQHFQNVLYETHGLQARDIAL